MINTQMIEAQFIAGKWAETTAAERPDILKKAASLMRERRDRLGEVMTVEQGKPLAESRGEIL